MGRSDSKYCADTDARHRKLTPMGAMSIRTKVICERRAHDRRARGATPARGCVMLDNNKNL